MQCRIREAKKEGVPVIDVDGSYLARKIQKLQDSGVNTAPLDLPSIPPAGWEVVSADNYQDFVDKIPPNDARYIQITVAALVS